MSSVTRQSVQWQGWTLYDWAVSAFQTSVVTVFIGPYLTALAQSQAINDRVFLGPIAMDPTSFVAYVIATSTLIQAILLPILGIFSDQAGLRSKLLWLTTILGSIFL